MDHLASFKRRVEDFLLSHSVSARDFGQRACNDASFVFDLRAGREPRSSTMARVDAWMQQRLDHGSAQPDGQSGCRVA